jgi:gentisate 1,2-dioxygenase
MDIKKTIETLLTNTEEIKKHYPTVDNVRHTVYDVPYSDLKTFAIQEMLTIHTEKKEKRVYIIYSPNINGKMDSDIWLYSTIVNIKPAEITEL